MSSTGGTSASASTSTSTGSNAPAMGLTLAGGLLSANAQRQAGRYNSDVAKFNAGYARTQASQALQAGQMQADQRDARERITEGATNAATAGQGIVTGAGTSSAIIAQERTASAMDKVMIGIRANREAFGYQVAAADQDARGKMALAESKNNQIATLLNTASQEELESDPNYQGYRGRGIR